MIVSILQLMGLAFGKPIQSRPGPDTQSGPDDKPSKVYNKGINRQNEIRVLPDQSQPARARSENALASSSRRQEVKAQTAKPKVQAKAKAPVEPARKSAQPVAKAAAKPVPKKVAPVVKTTAKPAMTKTASKAVPVKAVPVKAAAKSPVKAAKPAVQSAPKTVKTAAVSKAAAPEKRSLAPASEPVKAARPVVKTAPVPVNKVAVSAPPAPVLRPVSPVPPPAKAGRPSRLSQITVPSMAQSVASTAAKASYTNTMSSPVLIPPTYIPVKKDPRLANNWKGKTAEQLTDAEVLAMPDDEYMNDKQMAFFRLKLSQLKKEILSNAGETTEHLRADTVVVPDPADRATIEEEHALELRTRDRERKLLKKIEQSIIRIDAGDYGYCDETGEPIGVGRLLARPTATLSLEAQQRRELKQKMFGD